MDIIMLSSCYHHVIQDLLGFANMSLLQAGVEVVVKVWRWNEIGAFMRFRLLLNVGKASHACLDKHMTPGFSYQLDLVGKLSRIVLQNCKYSGTWGPNAFYYNSVVIGAILTALEAKSPHVFWTHASYIKYNVLTFLSYRKRKQRISEHIWRNTWRRYYTHNSRWVGSWQGVPLVHLSADAYPKGPCKFICPCEIWLVL